MQEIAYQKQVKDNFYKNQENIPRDARANANVMREGNKIQEKLKLSLNDLTTLTKKETSIYQRYLKNAEEFQKFLGQPQNSFSSFLEAPTASQEDLNYFTDLPNDIKKKYNVPMISTNQPSGEPVREQTLDETSSPTKDNEL